jgi:hypothetical protein
MLLQSAGLGGAAAPRLVHVDLDFLMSLLQHGAGQKPWRSATNPLVT